MSVRAGARLVARCAALLLGLLPLAVRAQELPLTHFTTENQVVPLPSAAVQQVTQDHLGFIWIAFYSSGIGRYDGHSLELYSIADGLPDLTAREIVQDGEGYLWVGTEGGLVVSTKPLDDYGIRERIRFRSTLGSVQLPRTRIRRNWISVATDGTVWVGTTADGLFGYHWKGKNLTVRRVSTAPANWPQQRGVVSMVALHQGDLLAALSDGAMLRVSGTEAVELAHAILPTAPVSALSEADDGSVWGGTTTGELWHSQSAREISFGRFDSSLNTRIFTVLQTPDRTLWAASLGAGVVRIPLDHREETRVLGRRAGFLSEALWSITFDREGNLWFAQNGGISRLAPDYRAFSAFTSISHSGEQPILPDPGAFTVLGPAPKLKGFARYLWVGTGDGVVAVEGDKPIFVLQQESGLRGKAVYSLDRNPDGSLWIGTGEGVNRLGSSVPSIASRAIRIVDQQLSLTTFDLKGPVYGCSHPPQNDLASTEWFAGQGGLFVFFDDQLYSFSGSGLPTTGVRNVSIDDDRYAWVATADSGLFRSSEPVYLTRLRALRSGVRPLRFEKAPIVDQILPSSTHAVAAIGPQVWVATSDGLYAIDRRNFKVRAILDAGNGLGGSNVMSVKASGRELWVAQNAGLAAVDLQHFNVAWKVGKEDGLLDNEVWAYSVISSGETGDIYLATAKGVAVYRPAADVRNMFRPSLVLRRADFRQSNNGENEIALEYAALSYANEAKVRYRTRLHGYDEKWSEPTRETKIRYTNLPAFLFDRHYVFEVEGTNEDAVSAALPLRYDFLVRPPVWFRWWALLLFVVLAALAIAFFLRHRTISLERLNRTLEETVRSRTEKIAAQADELRTFDQIVQVINREVTLERLLNALLEQGMLLFPKAEKAAFLVIDRSGDRCEVAASSGYDAELLRGLSFTMEEAVRRYCENAEFLGEGVYLSRNVGQLAGSDKTGHLPQPKAMLAMEVALSGMLEGFLVFDNFRDANAFESSDLQKLSRLRQHAISAIAKARILRELEIKNREAEQASQAKSAFLANMSHELRTPLNSIIGFSEILVERLDAQTEPKFVNFMRLILASGQHLLTLINDILDLSKIEAGKMEVYTEAVSLQGIVEGVCTIMRPLSAKKNIAFDVVLPEEPLLLETDAGKLKQILYNLLSNAVKFSPAGTTVHVMAGVDRGPTLVLAVRDEGIGIAAEHLGMIFEEFRQLDSTARRKYEGTGLGLSLVKKLVELQGGSIDVESQLGHGSTFHVTLPVRLLARQGQIESFAPSSQTVLVIEDDDAAFEMLRQQLTAASYKTVRARYAEEALSLARMLRPAAITLDLILPGADGWDVLRRLKGDESTKSIPVIIVSLSDNRELGLALGADDYLVKPIDRKLFVVRLQELIAARGTERRPLIVLIDDDTNIHQVVQEELGANGYTVLSAYSGEEGLRLVQQEHPDVVVLDLMMPGLSGFEVAQRLKNDPETMGIAIVVLTARDLAADERAALESRVTALVRKGARDGPRLVEVIQRLGHHSSVSAS